MRLLNTRTLQIEYFAAEAPQYTILTHTWGGEEVTFQECESRDSTIETRYGFRKFSEFCKIAAEAGDDYAWADTCFIDKSSSAELSESISSIYSWYRTSDLCYVYLSSVSEIAGGNHERFGRLVTLRLGSRITHRSEASHI